MDFFHYHSLAPKTDRQTVLGERSLSGWIALPFIVSSAFHGKVPQSPTSFYLPWLTRQRSPSCDCHSAPPNKTMDWIWLQKMTSQLSNETQSHVLKTLHHRLGLVWLGLLIGPHRVNVVLWRIQIDWWPPECSLIMMVDDAMVDGRPDMHTQSNTAEVGHTKGRSAQCNQYPVMMMVMKRGIKIGCQDCPRSHSITFRWLIMNQRLRLWLGVELLDQSPAIGMAWNEIKWNAASVTSNQGR